MNEALRSKSRPLSGISRGMTAVDLRHECSQRRLMCGRERSAAALRAAVLLKKILDLFPYYEVRPHFVGGSSSGWPDSNRRPPEPHLGAAAPENSAPDCYLGAVAGGPFRRLFFVTSLWPGKPPRHGLKRTTIDFWRRRPVRWGRTTDPRSVTGFCSPSRLLVPDTRLSAPAAAAVCHV